MGCTTCTQICSNEEDSLKPNNQFLLLAQQKAMLIRKTFSKPQDKIFINQYFSQDQFNIITHLMGMQEIFRPQNILLPQAGQLYYLPSIRRTLWKLYSFDILVYEYTKNQLIPPFTQDLSTIKLSQKAQQRFYQIGLDINRTFPTNKLLNRSHLELVLKNLTLYFDGVGYTQGMNFVVGFILLCGFQPKQAYWLFIHLSYNQNFLLIRNFSQGFKNVLFMIKVFQQYMDQDQKLNKIKSKVDEMGLTSFFYSFSWFLCYFLYSLEPKCCVLIWDYLLTYNPQLITQKKHSNTQKTPRQTIQQRSQFDIYKSSKQKQDPSYFDIIQKNRGSIINIINLGFELIQYLQQHIIYSQSAQHVLKILRNQNLIQMINPQIVMSMILKIRERISNQNKKNKDTNNNKGNKQSKQKLNWKYLINKMYQQDKQLYAIQTNNNSYRAFIQQSLGLRRNNQKTEKEVKIKIVSKNKPEI